MRVSLRTELQLVRQQQPQMTTLMRVSVCADKTPKPHSGYRPDTKIKRESLTFCLVNQKISYADSQQRTLLLSSRGAVNQLMTTSEGEEDDSEEEARGGKITYARRRCRRAAA